MAGHEGGGWEKGAQTCTYEYAQRYFKYPWGMLSDMGGFKEKVPWLPAGLISEESSLKTQS